MFFSANGPGRLLLTSSLLVIALGGSLGAQAQASGFDSAGALAAEIESAPTGAWIVQLMGAPSAQRDALTRLGELRRAGDQHAFRAQVESLRASLEAGRADVRASLAQLGLEELYAFTLIDAIAVAAGDEHALASLRAHPMVLSVERGGQHRALLAQATDANPHDAVGAHAITVGGVPLEGRGVTVAIIDSGIDTNANGLGRPHKTFYVNGDPNDLSGGGIGGSRILEASQESFFSPPGQFEDVHGHGTRMSSIAAGADYGIDVNVANGVAPEASIRSYKISDDLQGALANTLSMVTAFDKAAMEPDVLVANMSYDGEPAASHFLNVSIDNAGLADVFITLSAGNFGSDLTFAHGAYNALAVGGSNENSFAPVPGPLPFTSAIGPLSDGRMYPALIGQGRALSCALLDNELLGVVSNGSSGGAALTAGAGVLIRQADPTATALETRALILNHTADTTGNPDAAGLGYLKIRPAVEAALAGSVQQESVGLGEQRTYNRHLLAGEQASFTLVWNREDTNFTSMDDLDLRLRAPSGAIVAWSASAVDNVERIRHTASEDGVYKVEVLPISYGNDSSATYALAGVDSPSIQTGCGATPVAINDVSPGTVDAITPTGVNPVVLTGCGYLNTNFVSVGQTLLFPGDGLTIVDDNTLLFNFPQPDFLGTHPISVSVGAGQIANATIEVVADPPVLQNHHLNLGGGFVPKMSVSSQPGDAYFLVLSPQLGASELTGFYSFDIGAGNSSLLLVSSGSIEADGVSLIHLPQLTVPSGFPAGVNVHFQAGIFDSASASLPLESTNYVTSVTIIH